MNMNDSHDAFSRANVGPIQPGQNLHGIIGANPNVFHYSRPLHDAAENYMIQLFNAGGTTTRGAGIGESSYEHTIMLINAAMHIVSNNNWIPMPPQKVTMNIIEDSEMSDGMDGDIDDDDNRTS